MSPPIFTPDGSKVSEVILPDGATASKVIAPDGSTVVSAIPDSAVANASASGYDGNNWIANIGPDIPDASGNPTKTEVTANSTTFDVVRYQQSNSDISQTTNLSLSDDPQAIIVAQASRVSSVLSPRHYFDGGSQNEFTYFAEDNAPSNSHRIISGSSDTAGGSFDTNWTVWTLEGDGSTVRLIENDNTGSPILSDSSGYDSLTGLTLAGQGDVSSPTDVDISEYTVLENHSQDDRDSEIDRLMQKVGLK